MNMFIVQAYWVLWSDIFPEKYNVTQIKLHRIK